MGDVVVGGGADLDLDLGGGLMWVVEGWSWRRS